MNRNRAASLFRTLGPQTPFLYLEARLGARDQNFRITSSANHWR